VKKWYPPLDAFSELQRQIEANDLSKAFLRMQEQLEPHRTAFSELQRQIEANDLSKAFSRMQEQLEPHRAAFSELQRQIEANDLSKAFSRMQEQLEPHRTAFSELQRQIEANDLSNAISQMQEQAEALYETIRLFRLDPDLSGAASHVDHALDISRRMIRTIQTEVAAAAELPEHAVYEEQEKPANQTRVRELRDVQHAALADALAQLLAVVGIDPYFLRVWVETVTSDDVTQDEVVEMNAGLVHLLNIVAPPEDELNDS
jgi:S-adenosylmethionine/arginine decarboxylase-like enzyme